MRTVVRKLVKEENKARYAMARMISGSEGLDPSGLKAIHITYG